MRIEIRRDRFGGRAMGAAVVFFLLAAFEIVRTAISFKWDELTLLGSDFGLALAVLWVVTGVGIVMRARWAWPLMVYTAVSVLIHGAVIGIASDHTNDRLASLAILIGSAIAIVSVLRHMKWYGVAGYRALASTPPAR